MPRSWNGPWRRRRKVRVEAVVVGEKEVPVEVLGKEVPEGEKGKGVLEQREVVRVLV